MSFWTVDHIETLRTLWKKGYTATNIEHHFNGECSRSAVLGKLRRLGLSRKEKSEEENTTSASNFVSVSRKTESRRQNNRRSQKSQTAPVVTKNVETAINMMIPAPKKLAIMALNERTCKWPIGDPLHENFCYCGNDTNKTPYCPEHTKKAFQPATGGRRLKET